MQTKRLYIMRHAKSSWDHPGLTDFQRPLNQRGLQDAPRMGEWLAARERNPDWVYSSTAKRARGTAELVTAQFPDFIPENLRLTDEFYHASANVYLNMISQLDDNNHQAVMFVGHNPGLEELVQKLCGHYEFMSTAAIACFDLTEVTWQRCALYGTALTAIWRPKEIFR